MERKNIVIKPNRPLTRAISAVPPDTRFTPPNKEADLKMVAAMDKKPDNHFGTLVHRNKSIDMDALTKRILHKGSKEFDASVKELVGEVPPGCETGVLLTHGQICRMFGVTGMTVYDWRKRFNLPVLVLQGGKRPPIRYDEGVVTTWAALHGKKIMNDDYRNWV